ncbi:MAG: hypothetical protein Q9225_000023 [Loekoesia sp. 1 TL-2023]
MAHNMEMADQRLSLSESIRRKSLLTEKLNKLIPNPFSRRRTSGTLASSESSTSLRRRSRIPTSSFGSRTSSVFGDLKFHPADNTDSSGIQGNDRKGTQERRSTLTLRRRSRLPSGGISSFPGDTNWEEYLENLKPATVGKENKNRSSRHNEGSQVLYQRPDGQVFGETLDPKIADPSELNKNFSCKARRIKGSEDCTPVTAEIPWSIPDRLANANVSRLQSVRHSLAAVPQSCSPRSKDCESNNVIKERRLMAPINPPLPRSSTLGVVPNTSSAFTSPYQIAPRTPNFMRPTSSSAARTINFSKPFKSPPTPLNLTGGAKTDMLGFARHREDKRAAREYLGAHRISNGTNLGILPGTRLQMMSKNKQGAAVEPTAVYETEEQTLARRQAAKAATPPKVPDPTTSEEADFNRKSPGSVGNRIDPMRYPLGPRYTSTPELRAAYCSEEPPVPKLPRQIQQSVAKQDPDRIRQQIAAVAAREKERMSAEQRDKEADEPFRAAGRARPSAMFKRPEMPTKLSSAAGLSNGSHPSNGRQLPVSRIPRSTSKAGGLQPSISEHNLPLACGPPDHSSSSKPMVNERPRPTLRPDLQWYYDNDLARIAYERQQRIESNLRSVGLGDYASESDDDHDPYTLAPLQPQAAINPTHGNNDEEDITLVKEPQDLRYWAGRFTSANDSMRNDALTSPDTHFAHDDRERQNRVLQMLQDKCVTREAEESLASFVSAWRGGWTGGVGEICCTTVEVAPKVAPKVATPVVPEVEKKKGLMEKVFGRKKS